jgi:hypothetical protein
MPGELLLNDKPRLLRPGFGVHKAIWQYWRGYWPGPTAHAFNPVTHLKRLKLDEECWCGSGEAYKACHRPSDVEASRAMA